jgi:hypothetical protein
MTVPHREGLEPYHHRPKPSNLQTLSINQARMTKNPIARKEDFASALAAVSETTVVTTAPPTLVHSII